MPTKQSRRLTIAEITADQAVIVAVKALTDYAPADKTYSIAKLADLSESMELARQNEIRANNAISAARDAAYSAEWDMHEAVLRTKAQVMAQYGPDSDEVQALGLKKRSDRKRPVRRARATQ